MGILIALAVIAFWMWHLIYSLFYFQVDFSNFWTYLHILIQAFLYTGLFITAHDSMHRTISRNKIINNTIGALSTFLFAGMSFNRLMKNHKLHHDYPGTEKDPDFCTKSQNFFVWWTTFLIRYTTLTQIIVMGIAYNLFKYAGNVNELNLWLFWIIPAFLGTFQLFYYGTYMPHKYPHTEEMMPYNSRSLPKNHLWAMISCYFFGYHWEHHQDPSVAWWQLWKTK